MSAISIERITKPDEETFFREYVSKQRPVIITNLLAGQPISQIDTLEKAREAFGGAKLMVQHEYTAAGAGKTEPAFLTMAFDEYWDVVRNNPATTLCCTEYEVPARIMALFELPSMCLARESADAEILGLPRKYGAHDLLSNLFVANRGNRAHLHYDGDHRQVLLHQVFGRKEVILFPTRSGTHLKPLDIGLNFSGWFLEKMTADERLSLVDDADGYYAMLAPGETVYIPMLMWHYLGYVDDGMSFNIRFGRTRYGRFLCADNFHRDHYIQNFASKMVNGTAGEQEYVDALIQISNEYASRVPSMLERVKAMRALFKKLCSELCPEHRAHEYCPPEWEAVELERIMRDVRGKALYADAATLAQMRPAGPASAAQIRHIQDHAIRFGYPAGLLERLLRNRLGKSSPSSFSMVEAAQFLSYMRSPGAAWN